MATSLEDLTRPEALASMDKELQAPGRTSVITVVDDNVRPSCQAASSGSNTHVEAASKTSTTGAPSTGSQIDPRRDLSRTFFAGCAAKWRKRFSWRAFLLSHESESLFVEPRRYVWLCGSGSVQPWQQWTFLLYRFLVLTYWSFWAIFDAVTTIREEGKIYFIYLTNWNALACTTYFLVAFITTLEYTLFRCPGDRPGADSSKEPGEMGNDVDAYGGHKTSPPTSGDVAQDELRLQRQANHLNWSHRIVWLLHNICMDASVLVVVGFWSTINTDPEARKGDGKGGLGLNRGNDDPRMVNVHVVILGLMLLESGVAAIPFRLAHVIYMFIYSCGYVAFTLIYWGAGGTRLDGKRYIYKPIDYSRLGAKTVWPIAVSLLVIVPLSHVIMWLWHLFCTWFTGALAASNQVDNQSHPENGAGQHV